MFRFWATEPRVSKLPEPPQPTVDIPTFPTTTLTAFDAVAQSPKRRRQSCDEDESPLLNPRVKRVCREETGPSGLEPTFEKNAPRSLKNPDHVQTLRDKIEHILGTEILVKHNEKRIIDLELAKCQTALEQLRRCHLIPFPSSHATPEQRVAISNGTGPALKNPSTNSVPRWAPPFGVVDGPYARHYAHWLIPDPAFDGMEPEGILPSDGSRMFYSSTEGRTTRQTMAEIVGPGRGRPSRAMPAPRLQALTGGRTEPKKKSGPCILKRADGQTVKLVCIDCQREDFSSTQGFINHCRIAHKRDFKSHEEAAVKSGHAIDAAAVESSPTVTSTPEERAPPQVVKSTPSVHPFARPDMSEQQAYIALRSRIADSMELLRQGKLPGVTSIPRISVPTPGDNGGKGDFVPETPYLSSLLKSKAFDGKLQDIVKDAKTRVSLDDILPDEDDVDMDDTSSSATPVRVPVVKRVPAKSTKSSAQAANHLAGNKHHGHHIGEPHTHPRRNAGATSDDDADMEEPSFSPNTIGNNAPSLVSDDGEYDDSDEGSSVSGQSDALDAESVSDIAEINLDEDHDPRGLRRTSTGVSSAVCLRRDDPKHVSFVSPMTNSRKESHHPKA